MATPIFTIRVDEQHHPLLRAIVARLKEDTGFAAVLQGVFSPYTAPKTPDAPSSAPTIEPDIQARLDDIEDRVLALEERRTGRPRVRPTRKPTDEEKARLRAWAAEVRAKAQAEGVPVTELARRVAAAMNRAEKGTLAYLYGERPFSPATEARIREVLGMESL